MDQQRIQHFIHELYKRKKYFGSILSSVIVVSWLCAWARRIGKPKLKYLRTARNEAIISLLQSYLSRRYVPSLITPEGNSSSAIGYLRVIPKFQVSRELIRTWDGGNFALDWRTTGVNEPDLKSNAPILIIIHGLNGNSDESYVRYCMEMGHRKRFRAVAFNNRGCGGTTLSSPWGYSGAFTGDIRLAINTIHERYPDAPVFAVGFSLGANLLVKYLGEDGTGGYAPVTAAVSVSNPWNFENTHLADSGVSEHHSMWERVLGKIYAVVLTSGLRSYLKGHSHSHCLAKRKDLNLNAGMNAVSLVKFDSAITVPMWGYKDIYDYHKDASSRRYLRYIKVPLLCLNAEDDPIITPVMWPTEEDMMNPNVIFVSTKAGGHIGWTGGMNPFHGISWADELFGRFFDAVLEIGWKEEWGHSKL